MPAVKDSGVRCGNKRCRQRLGPLPVLLTLLIASSLAYEASLKAYGQYQAPSTLQGKTIIIPIGTTFEGRIDSTIGSAVSRQGERFVISMSSPILANGIEVLIPAGSEVIGEVVEAIPSNKVPHQKIQGKQIGKLRVQLTSLKTPDGLTFPLVASIVPDKSKTGQGAQGNPLGTGVAYVGSQSSFEAVAPGNPRYVRPQPGQAPRVLSPGEIMRDPILGRDQNYANSGFQSGMMIRSLVRKKNDLFIYSGSPVSMRIDAPFKISLSSSQGAAATLNAPLATPETAQVGGRRFNKDGFGSPPGPPANSNPIAPQAAPPSAKEAVQPAQPAQPVHKRDPNDSEF
jgi:hypothetical protein